ncbi:(Fe-S)-binding protein [Pelagicoccus sp. SDUM812002]|uniref:(Fe-S)-binding protein n=1 Tax=Pelagicoccus sp. SDUM812002 TaxID=3041266 RepID=UPI00280D1B07|nr:(Fe-S)-binding protein [Pelagicoccus sp. SDUM812002]MDQ8185382.1 (Fe-S)-binding protein [Pelagicoccus sp. SDUM812002]
MLSAKNFLKELDYSVLQQCMHCGMCLPVCPTYTTTKKERNSPRGRISLMRAVADDELRISEAFGEEMYYCLGCLACTTACPAGVDYANLFENARAQVEEEGILDTPERSFWRWLTLKVLFSHPRLLRASGRLLYHYQQLKLDELIRKSGLLNWIVPELAKLEPMTPKICHCFSDTIIKEREIPRESRYKVGFLSGCVQDLAFSDVNRDTVDVLLANRCEVVTPRVQPCCGSLHGHNGAHELAKDLARKTIDQFDDLGSFDAIISNAGGCGSHLKHYHRLLADDPDYAEKASLWDSKLKDIHEFLTMIERVPFPSTAGQQNVTYHDSCHLCHGQKISQQPRDLLKLIPGLKFEELPEANHCCGSAGIYNITQPEESQRQLDRKLDQLAKTRSETVATANPGCHLQIQNGINGRQLEKRVAHPITLLAEAYRSQASESLPKR